MHQKLIVMASLTVLAGCGAAAAIAATASQPTEVTAHAISPDARPYAPGTRVGQSSLGNRVFTGAKRGFALANLRNGSTYPATTTDGGRTWRIAGGHFHIAAANGPAAVTEVGAGGRGTYFAYAGPGGGQAVDVTTDGGKHWWQAFLPGQPEAVVYSAVTRPGELIAFEQGHPTYVYVSKDGGRHWRLSHSDDS